MGDERSTRGGRKRKQPVPCTLTLRKFKRDPVITGGQITGWTWTPMGANTTAKKNQNVKIEATLECEAKVTSVKRASPGGLQIREGVPQPDRRTCTMAQERIVWATSVPGGNGATQKWDYTANCSSCPPCIGRKNKVISVKFKR